MMPLISTTLTAATSTIGTSSSQHPLPPLPPLKLKKKRNVGGNPDPDATVMALSPRTIMNPKKFICEVCYKSFPREQNLQMHYRGHNRLWKLTAKKVKRAFVCPDETCVHHHPSRALQDLSAIKKHYIRKHGEKNWKCETCPKAYALQGDLKAHAKICVSTLYKCDHCEFTAYRKDDFAKHKTICDELAANHAIMSTTLPQTSISFQSLLHPIMPSILGSIPDRFSTTSSMLPPVFYTGDAFNPVNNSLNPGSFGVGDFSTTSQFSPIVPSENYTEDTFNQGSFGVGDFSTTPLLPLVLPSKNYPANALNPGSSGVGDFSTTPLSPEVLPSENYPGDTLNSGSFGVGDISTTPNFPPVLPSENYPGNTLNPVSFGVGDFSTIPFFPPVLPSENYLENAPNPGSFGVGDFSTISLFPPNISSENNTGDALNPVNNTCNPGSFDVDDYFSTSFFPPDVSLKNYSGDSFDRVGGFSPSLPGTSFDMSGRTIGEGTQSQDLTRLPPLPESLEIPSLLENDCNPDMLGFPWPNWN